jgi:hypothetical protein
LLIAGLVELPEGAGPRLGGAGVDREFSLRQR